jgi:hypothetical protein
MFRLSRITFAFEMLDFATYFPSSRFQTLSFRPSLTIVYIVTSSTALISPDYTLHPPQGYLYHITTQQQPRPPFPALPSNAISGYTLTTCSLYSSTSFFILSFP